MIVNKDNQKGRYGDKESATCMRDVTSRMVELHAAGEVGHRGHLRTQINRPKLGDSDTRAAGRRIQEKESFEEDGIRRTTKTRSGKDDLDPRRRTK